MQLLLTPVATKLLPNCKIQHQEYKEVDYSDSELRTMVIDQVLGKKRFILTRFLGDLKAVECSYEYSYLGETYTIDVITEDAILDIFYGKPEDVLIAQRRLFHHYLFSGVKVKKIGLIIPKQQQVTVWNLAKWKKMDTLQALFQEFYKNRFTEEQELEYTALSTTIGTTVRYVNASFDKRKTWQVGPQGHEIPEGYKVYMHSNCEINLGKANTYRAHVELLKNAVKHKLLGYVIHTGSNENQMEGLHNLRENIKNLSVYATKDCPVLLENTAGQGHALLTKLDDFAKFTSELQCEVIASCLDTCHVYSAGYCPLSALNYLYNSGIKIKLLHFNDSLNPIGSKIDRHQAIGKGFIGSTLIAVAKMALKYNIDIVREC